MLRGKLLPWNFSLFADALDSAAVGGAGGATPHASPR